MNKRTNMLVMMAMMIALNVVLSRFVSINAWNIKIGFTFVTVYAIAHQYGYIAAAVTAALGDFIGAILFPIGPYYPPFTISAAVTGIVYGLLLYQNEDTKRIIAAVAINQFIIGLLINSYWIHLLYKADFAALLSTRILQSCIMTAVEIITIKLINKYLF